jgi:transposase InsO family protein
VDRIDQAWSGPSARSMSSARPLVMIHDDRFAETMIIRGQASSPMLTHLVHIPSTRRPSVTRTPKGHERCSPGLGVVYAAFVVDLNSPAVVGWSTSTSKRTKLILDALQMAMWRRDRAGHNVEKGLIYHPDRDPPSTRRSRSPHTCSPPASTPPPAPSGTRWTTRMESTIGPYKAELINRRGPWTLADVKLAPAEWIYWNNTTPHPPGHRRRATRLVREPVGKPMWTTAALDLHEEQAIIGLPPGFYRRTQLTSLIR